MAFEDDVKKVYELLDKGFYPEEYHVFASEIEDAMSRIEEYVSYLETRVRKIDRQNKEKRENDTK
jgi:hypothetical protein